MGSPKFIIRRIEKPSEDAVSQASHLAVELMHNNLGAITLAHDVELLAVMMSAMIRAGALSGELYWATTISGEFVGYAMWMPPGRDLFSTEEERKLGINEFMERLPDSTKDYFKNVYMSQFPAFVNDTLGPRGKTDSWWLHQAMVRKEYHRQGVCRALVNVVIEKAKLNSERLALTTTSDENIAVYTSLGFTYKATKMMPSPLGEWPIHVFEMRTGDM